ncbi:L-threonylcarbamoyladenylate synthase [Aquibium sp. ELW1220]|uniref:L-threonylcarbamoyladenylate synthase n=1 Tax=Aquibium sp. ELW1220 TaxID=2976766 RepID=UPI0025AFECEF|nr:L-threonylcarbamoyladenylate synthase [Aquibium sp. ELW1220]MDN2583679.1 L-threonylcarbamoyladenylate synthase [Aquibium sp. ELW1220]
MADIVPEAQALARASELILAGLPVALPTETVYGLAADATSGQAVARIYEAKGRPRFNPLIVHVADRAMADRIGILDPLSRKLADAFWPGPLTLVVPLREDAGISPLVTAGLDTVGLRMPVGFAASLVAATGRPLAAPSANSSGRVSATSAQAVAADLGHRIPLVVDGGPTPVGIESTIVKVENGELRLLRPGGVAASDIEAVAGMPLRRALSAPDGWARAGEAPGAAVEAPGMLASHYAPRAAVRLGASAVGAGEALLAFGPVRIPGAENALAVANLSPAGSLREAAANLFAMLIALDASGAAVIAVEPVPTEGLGEAIADRLSRAAAPRG